jgi:hypothetical protein
VTRELSVTFVDQQSIQAAFSCADVNRRFQVRLAGWSMSRLKHLLHSTLGATQQQQQGPSRAQQLLRVIRVT